MLSLRSGVLMQTLEDQAVLLDTRAARYFELNQTGVELLSGLLAGESESDVIARLAARYRVPDEQIASDLVGLVAALRAHGLLA